MACIRIERCYQHTCLALSNKPCLVSITSTVFSGICSADNCCCCCCCCLTPLLLLLMLLLLALLLLLLPLLLVRLQPHTAALLSCSSCSASRASLRPAARRFSKSIVALYVYRSLHAAGTLRSTVRPLSYWPALPQATIALLVSVQGRAAPLLWVAEQYIARS
jgi:hypothetical protein